jgi:hypothetical protein
VDNGSGFHQPERAMGHHKRIRRGAEGWRGLFSRQSSSGLSVTEFCRSERINASLFRRWRARLQEGGGQPVVTRAVPAGEVAVPFIDLGDLRTGGSRFEVRLELGAGMILSIARG